MTEVRRVAPPYGDVVVVVGDVDVVAAVVDVVATVDDGGMVAGIVEVVSSPLDEHAVITSANTATATSLRRYLIGMPLPPMPPDCHRAYTMHPSPCTSRHEPRVLCALYAVVSPRNERSRELWAHNGIYKAENPGFVTVLGRIGLACDAHDRPR